MKGPEVRRPEIWKAVWPVFDTTATTPQGQAGATIVLHAQRIRRHWAAARKPKKTPRPAKPFFCQKIVLQADRGKNTSRHEIAKVPNERLPRYIRANA